MGSKFSKPERKSIIRTALEEKKRSVSEVRDNFKVSFQYLDSSQKYASSFRDWQKAGLLSKMLEVIQGYCCRRLNEQIDGNKFTIYGDFPPQDKTLFIKPVHIPEDAKWARIHITGRAVVVGYVVSDTFYVVFLDRSHKFYLTKYDLMN